MEKEGISDNISEKNPEEVLEKIHVEIPELMLGWLLKEVSCRIRIIHLSIIVEILTDILICIFSKIWQITMVTSNIVIDC